MAQKKNVSKRKLTVTSDNSSFGFVEAYKAVRANISYLLPPKDKGYVLMITSSIPGEGKSNVSVNLAYTFAQDNKKVILVDCDLRKGMLHRYLNIGGLQPGMTAVMSGKASLEEAIEHISAYGFDFLPVGALPTNPSELIGSASMSGMLNALANAYDYVICDTAPVNAVSDTSVLCRFVDGTIFVISHNDVTKKTAIAGKEMLDAADANIIGIIMNKYDAKETGGEYSGYYSYYNYSDYGYGYGESDK